MSKKPDQHALQRLRAAAEAQLAGVPPAGMPVHPAGELLHELRVHQIELKMQNDELRRAQLAMEESRDRYLDLYDFAPVGYLTLTREALISEINLTGAALLGKARGKLVHSRFARFVAPEDSDRWHLHFMRTLQHGDRQGCELALRRADGSRFDARLDCLYLVKEGNAPAVRIILTDITERKQAEAGRLLRQIFDMPFIGMAVTSPATKRWRDCNARLCEILGYSREELAEKNWLEMTHPDDMEASVAEFERVMRGESECYRMDKRFIRKDGAVVFVTIDEKCVRKPDGTVDYFVKMVQDITGYNAEEVLGKNPRMMDSGRQDKAFYVEMWQQLLRTGAWSGEIWDRRKNGQIYPKWMTVTAVKNEPCLSGCFPKQHLQNPYSIGYV